MFSQLDVVVLSAYGAGLLWIGLRIARRHPSQIDMTLGQRSIPAWAVLCSMTATELSAATFIGVPHAAYVGDWSYAQLAFGALLGKAVVAQWVIPLYHDQRVVTVYGFLENRFGARPQRAAALGFVLGRLLASGTRLFIAALALAALTPIPIEWAIVTCGVLAGAYTWMGGIRAVIQTDVLQSIVLITAAIAVLASLLWHSDQGPASVIAWFSDPERTRIFHTQSLWSLESSRTLGSAVIGAFFLTLAAHATDHDMVQRLLTTRTSRGGSAALLGSALLNFPLTLLFLAIGTGLAHFYADAPGYDISDQARILPLYAFHELPSGLRGLLFAGLFAAAMSSLDSAICALATSWTEDIRKLKRDGSHAARRIRITSACFTALLIACALVMATYHRYLEETVGANAPNLVEFALSAMTIFYGALLGTFGLGILTRTRGSSRSVLLGLLAGALAGLVLFLHPLLTDRILIAWTWWIPCSALLTVIIAGSRPTPRRPHP